MAREHKRVNTEKRNFIVYSRLTKQERSWLETMAANERRTMSDMIRQSVAEAARTRGLWPEERQEEAA